MLGFGLREARYQLRIAISNCVVRHPSFVVQSSTVRCQPLCTSSSCTHFPSNTTCPPFSRRYVRRHWFTNVTVFTLKVPQSSGVVILSPVPPALFVLFFLRLITKFPNGASPGYFKRTLDTHSAPGLPWFRHFLPRWTKARLRCSPDGDRGPHRAPA